MSQALYRKWRPHLWEQVVGQPHIVTTLKNAIRSQRFSHAYLFAGPRGTGKTTTARLLAKALNCLAEDPAGRPCDQCDHCLAVNEGRFLDLIEIDAASNTSVDDVRDLREKINFSPSQGKYKVYIIDEVHMLSTAAFNALLKTLEEPPQHAVFILATTEIHKIPATVLSRCQRHEFRRMAVDDIVGQLKSIAEGEKLPYDPEALTLIARQATGGMRDAISLLDQLSSSGEKITLAVAQSVLGTATSQSVIDLVDAVVNRQPAAGLDSIHTALDAGTDPRQFARQVVEYLRNVLLVKMGNAAQVDATKEMRDQLARHALAFSQSALVEAIRLFNTAAADTRGGWQPSLLLELALAEAIEPQPTAAPVAAVQVPVQSQPPASVATTAPVPPAPPAKPPAQAQPKPSPVPTPPPSAESQRAGPATAQPNLQPSPPPAADAGTPADQQSGAKTGYTLNDIVQNWPRIRAVVKKKRSQTEALLNSCKPLMVKDGILVLGFKTELVKEKMETADNLQLTGQAIYHILGANMPIRCVVMSANGSQVPNDMDVDSEGMVGTALNLGAEIVHKE